MSAPLNIGVIGLGKLGSLYARYFQHRIAGARLQAVTDVRAETARRISAETGAPKVHAATADLLADRSVDAVVVVTPTKLHGEVVAAAARAGKAVFCEKPLSLEVAEGEAMEREVARTGVFFQLGLMRRFDPAYAAAKRRIDAGEIGTPLVFKATSKDPVPPPLDYVRPENSGGLFIDMGVHDFDLARWYMGEAVSAYSVGGALAHPEIGRMGDVDNGVTALVFRSGAIGSVHASRTGVYGYGIEAEICGTAGAIKIGYDRETAILVMRRGRVEHDTVPGYYERFEQAYVSQLQNFVDNVRLGRPSPIGCREGIAAQRIAVAATKSCRSGKPELI